MPSDDPSLRKAPDASSRIERQFAHPDQIGPYKILGVLGEGGMGVVYEAQQTEPIRRHVALKVIKVGMDTKAVVTRFDAERQALAVMEHPHIAKVLDAGSTEGGSPYFVMEHVKGVRLTRYCDQAKLTTRQRLELFVGVCDALQHAHQKGVIHRDLKPSNVLVTEQNGAPSPRVIDFGIAKAIGQQLTEQTLQTATGLLVGTPAYMSPEQAVGSADIDTRADIYTLGVMLYELLAGVMPIDISKLGPRAILYHVLETDPPTLSERLRKLNGDGPAIAAARGTNPERLRRELKGDLDWIVLKAMEKERDRRYETANGLALDIQRYLRDEPIRARPPSRRYRLQKFVKRNRVGVIAATAALVALIGGTIATTTGLVRATRAEAAARLEAATATQVSDFLVSLFQVSDPNEARGNAITARAILDEGAQRIDDELQEQPLVQARLMHTMGSVYANLGLYRTGLSLGERALAIREQQLGPDHLEVAASMSAIALMHEHLGNIKEALPMSERALRIREAALGAEDTLVVVSLQQVAEFLVSLGRMDEADPLLLRALTVNEKLLPPDHENLAVSYERLGWRYKYLRRLDTAEILIRQARDIRAQKGDSFNLARDVLILGAIAQDRGTFASAISLYQESLGLLEATPDHPRRSSTLAYMAICYHLMGRDADAEPLVERSMEVLERLGLLDNYVHAYVLETAAEIYESQGRNAEAMPLRLRVVKILENDYGPDDANVARGVIMTAYNNLRQRRYPDAERQFERVLALREGDAPAWEAREGEVSGALIGLAQLREGQGRLTDARRYYQRAMTMLEDPSTDDSLLVASQLALARNGLANLARDQGLHGEAEQLYRQAIAGYEDLTWYVYRLDRLYVMAERRLAECLQDYAKLLEQMGRATEARDVEARAVRVLEEFRERVEQ